MRRGSGTRTAARPVGKGSRPSSWPRDKKAGGPSSRGAPSPKRGATAEVHMSTLETMLANAEATDAARAEAQARMADGTLCAGMLGWVALALVAGLLVVAAVVALSKAVRS